MHFKLNGCVIVSVSLVVITSIARSGNFHDFEASCERIHYRCRGRVYPFSVERLNVPDELVRWDHEWEGYKPPLYTALSTVGQPWADPDIADKSFSPHWNRVDGLIDRRSHVSKYNVSEKYPMNPIGRTGLAGRGILGRWGPNHASDSVVTRWKTNAEGELILDAISQKPILQLISIQKHNGEWGIPGGMINPGETVAEAGKREFFEEVLAYEFSTNESVKMIDDFFNKGVEIYTGYVDDPRNTDNAWVETVAIHYHDAGGGLFSSLRLMAGDDACAVAWKDVDRDIQLYSAHQKFVYEMTSRLNAHF